MNSVYMVTHSTASGLVRAGEEVMEVVEFVPRSEVTELVAALRAAYDVAIISDLADGELERIVGLLNKWEAQA